MLLTDLPTEVLVLILGHLKAVALWRVYVSKTRLSYAAMLVCNSRHAAADQATRRKLERVPAMHRNLAVGCDALLCCECLAATTDWRQNFVVQPGQTARICAECTSEPGGHHELITHSIAEGVVKDALKSAGRRTDGVQVSIVLVACIRATYQRREFLLRKREVEALVADRIVSLRQGKFWSPATSLAARANAARRECYH